MKRWRYLIAAAVAAGSMAHAGRPGRAARNGGGKGATGNGKYGLIDTTGQYVSRNDFD